jgi:MYXO-CTERM domain-containing protein
VVTTPWGLDDATVNDGTVRILGPGDVPVPARVSRYGDHGNTLMIRPMADLAYDTPYRVSLSASLRTLEGSLTGAEQTIAFRTRCAPDRLAQCPPLPTPRPTLSAPPVSTPRPPPGLDAGSGTVVIEPDDAGALDAAVHDAALDAAMAMDAGGAPTKEGCGCRAGASGAGRGVGWLSLVALAGLSRRRQRRAPLPSISRRT